MSRHLPLDGRFRTSDAERNFEPISDYQPCEAAIYQASETISLVFRPTSGLACELTLDLPAAKRLSLAIALLESLRKLTP